MFLGDEIIATAETSSREMVNIFWGGGVLYPSIFSNWLLFCVVYGFMHDVDGLESHVVVKSFVFAICPVIVLAWRRWWKHGDGQLLFIVSFSYWRQGVVLYHQVLFECWATSMAKFLWVPSWWVLTLIFMCPPTSESGIGISGTCATFPCYVFSEWNYYYARDILERNGGWLGRFYLSV